MQNLSVFQCFWVPIGNVVQISADFSEFFGRYVTKIFPNANFFWNLKENATKWQNTHVKKKEKKRYIISQIPLKKRYSKISTL